VLGFTAREDLCRLPAFLVLALNFLWKRGLFGVIGMCRANQKVKEGSGSGYFFIFLPKELLMVQSHSDLLRGLWIWDLSIGRIIVVNPIVKYKPEVFLATFNWRLCSASRKDVGT